MRRAGVLMVVVLVLSAGLVALGAAGAGGQTEPATFGYTVQFVSVTPLSAPEEGTEAASPADAAGLVLSGDGDVSALQGDLPCQLVRVELATGALTPLPADSPEACAGDLAFAPDGTLYGLLQGFDEASDTFFPELVRFDTTTGAAEVVGNIGTSTRMLGGQGPVPFGGITFSGTGQLLVALVATDEDGADPACRRTDTIVTCLYRIDDPANPAAVTFLGEIASIASDQDGTLGSTLASTCDTVYMTPALTEPIDAESSLVVGSELASVDAATGGITVLGTYPDTFVSWGAALDPGDGFWGLGLEYPIQLEFAVSMLVLDPSAGTPVATAGAPVATPPDTSIQGLEIAPFDCTPEIVLEPTFTG